MRSRRETERNQMAAHDERHRRGVGDGQPLRLGQKPCAFGERDRRVSRSPLPICACHTYEPIDTPDRTRQPSDCCITRPRIMELLR